MTAIIEDGESRYQILTPGRRGHAASASAARNLQDALLKMTGLRLPVRSARQRVAGRPAIRVGEDDRHREPDLWEKDAYEIRPEGEGLVLTGRPPRATHYAVCAFLESLGARFYGPDDVVLPSRSRVPLPDRAESETAAMTYRHVFYPTAQQPEWALRWKLNVHNGRDPRWGRNARAHSWGHSFDRLVSGGKYFDEHPEYFSLVDGRRHHNQPWNHQLCCTNPEVADIASETMARWIEQNPDRRIFAVGQNDGSGWCECPQCAAVDEEQGSHAGQVLTLVNRVAEHFPDRIIATLAYSWSAEPPRTMRARENVLIVLCHNEGCFTHGLEECEPNEVFLNRLKGWRRKAEHILIWDYYVNYHSYLLPTPNFRRIGRDLRLYRDLGVTGMFCQGSAVRGGQFEGIRQYLLSRMLWDPDRDAWPIVEDWVRGVYGEEPGGCVLDYLEMLHDHVEETEAHVTSYGRDQEIQPHIFTPEILRRGKELWDQAEGTASSEERARKVFAARAPEMCSRLFHVDMNYHVEDGRLRPDPPPDTELRDRFVRAALQGGAAHLRENAAAPEEFARNYGRSYRAAVLENDRLRAVAVPEMGGRLFSLRWKKGDLELLHVDDLLKMVNYMPVHCSYEFSPGAEGLPAASEQEFDLLEEASDRTVMELEMEGRMRVRYEFRLDGDTLSLLHTVENQDDEPIALSPCAHPEWHYQAFGDAAELAFATESGQWRTVPVNPEDRRERNQPYRGEELPAGRWRLTSAEHPVAVEQRFDPDELDHARLRLHRLDRHLNLELHFRPVELQAGEQRTFGVDLAISPAPR
ncbi:MAG: DUF4838 domain-containing protein [Planctomycetota bacterium]